MFAMWIPIAAAADPALGAEVVVIGEFASMTGGMASFGHSTHQGLSLAIDEANALESGGRSFRLVVSDDRGTREGAAEAVEHLVTVEGAVVLVGEVASSLSLAGGAVAQQLGVPMVSPASTNGSVTTIGDRVFRACATDAYQGQMAAAFAAGPLKARTAVILSDASSTYSQVLTGSFERAFVARGGRVSATLPYQSGDTDFRLQLRALRKARPDVVFLPGLYTDVASIAVAAQDRGLDVTFVGADGWDSDGLVEAAGPAVEGAYYVNHFAADSPEPGVAAFVEAYQRAYGTVPDGLAALGYDAGRMVVDALRRAPTTSGADLAAALATVRGLAAVTGPLTMGPDRDPSKPMVVMQLRDGRASWAATVPPE